MKISWLVFLLSLLVLGLTNCTTLKKVSLSEELEESSALVIHKKQFLTINDSGNTPYIYVFNKKGEVIHKSYVKNVKNIDWEAMAFDGNEYLYIGDIGNNRNNRKDLRVLKVKMDEVMEKDTVSAEIISFHYPEQKEFPPSKHKLYYDAEAMIYKEGELLVFTKNRTIPFDGISKVYFLPIQPGNYEAKLINEIHLPPTHWIEESITDAFFFENGLYILTYSKLYKLTWQNDNWQIVQEWLHESISQKEGVAVTKKYIYIVDEDNENFVNFYKQKGNFLYRLPNK